MALGISDAVSISGRLVELAKAAATLELREEIMRLREAVLNAQEEILGLRSELGELKRAATEQVQLRFDPEEGVYWRDITDKEFEGPFCQRCYDVTGKLVRLQSARGGSGYSWRCTGCSRTY